MQIIKTETTVSTPSAIRKTHGSLSFEAETDFGRCRRQVLEDGSFRIAGGRSGSDRQKWIGSERVGWKDAQ